MAHPSSLVVSVSLHRFAPVVIALLAAACGSPDPNAPSSPASEPAGDLLESQAQALHQPAEWAYAWNQTASPPLNTPYNAEANYSRNSAAGINTLKKVSTGLYVLSLGNLGTVVGGGGVPHVVAYGNDNRRCIIGSFGKNGSAFDISVKCFTETGADADSRFVVTYQRRTTTISPFFGAYFWNDHKETSAPAEPAFSWNSAGGANVSNRTATGIYQAVLPGLGGAGGAGSVHVTAFLDTGWCQVDSWFPVGSDMFVNIRCFDANGNPANRYYTLSYSTLTPLGGNSSGYAWGNNSTSTTPYNPDPSYRRVQKNGTVFADGITAQKVGTGTYLISYTSPSLNPTGSAAMVTSYGQTPKYCKIESWQGATNVNMKCYPKTGSSGVDSLWVSTYITDQF